jgi:type IV pilus assembly protein PilM
MPAEPSGSRTSPLLASLQRLIRVTPKEPKLTVGVDIGSSSVKVLALGPRYGKASRPVLGQHLVPVREDQEADPSEAVKAAVGALAVPVRTVTLSVSGQWVIMRVVELPKMKPDEMRQALPFEAQRYLPFNIQEVVLDGAVLGPSEGDKVWVLIVACKKELLERRFDWARRAGLEATVIDVDALALTNSFLASRDGQQAEGTRALVNLGAQLTNLVVFRGNVPYLVRDIPWGGEKLVRSTAEQLGKEAEVVRQELLEAQASPELRGALQVTSEALVTELQLSFDYFENRFGQAPAELLVSGGVSQCGAFLDGLKSHLAQTVSAWSPVQGLSGQFAVAYGLALRSG